MALRALLWGSLSRLRAGFLAGSINSACPLPWGPPNGTRPLAAAQSVSALASMPRQESPSRVNQISVLIQGAHVFRSTVPTQTRP